MFALRIATPSYRSPAHGICFRFLRYNWVAKVFFFGTCARVVSLSPRAPLPQLATPALKIRHSIWWCGTLRQQPGLLSYGPRCNRHSPLSDAQKGLNTYLVICLYVCCAVLCRFLVRLFPAQEAERQRKKEEAAKEADSRERAVLDMAERAKAAMLEAERRRAAEVGGETAASLLAAR